MGNDRRFLKSRPPSRSRPFARIPAWIFKIDTPAFKSLRPTEAKILLYLASKIDNITDETPSFTWASLSRATGICNDIIPEAIKVLQNLGVLVLLKTKRGKKAARILFSLPPCRPLDMPAPPLVPEQPLNYYPYTRQARLTPSDDQPPKKSATTTEEIGGQAPRKSVVADAEKNGEPSTAIASVDTDQFWAGSVGGGVRGKFCADDPEFLAKLRAQGLVAG